MRTSSLLWIETLTLQGPGVNEMDGARHSDTHAHLPHVPQTLRQPRWKAHYVVLVTRRTRKHGKELVPTEMIKRVPSTLQTGTISTEKVLL